MQKKGFIKKMTAVVLAASMCVPCVSAAASEGEKKTIHIYSMKIEIDEGLKALTEKYTETHPDVEFVIESTSNDFFTGLKTKFTGGSAPDIFSMAGYSDIVTWQSHLADLTDEPWTADVIDAARNISETGDGKVYAFPLAVEGSAYMYHTDLFEEAGVTEMPTTPAELEEAIKKVTDAGVCDYPLIENYLEWYQAGTFFLNYAIAAQDDPLALIEDLNSGEADLLNNEYFQQMADFFTLEASLCNNEATTDFNTQTSNFATKKAAMTFGGNWAQPTLDAVDPDLQVALAPVPVFEDPEKNGNIYLNASYWGVNKDSEALEEIKEFLNWLATDPEGQEGITKTLQLIPGFTTFEADAESCGLLGQSVAKYIKEGKTLGAYSAYYPDGGLETFGNEVCKFIAGASSKEEFLQSIQDEWANLAN